MSKKHREYNEFQVLIFSAERVILHSTTGQYILIEALMQKVILE
jgi:hypothetical protein